MLVRPVAAACFHSGQALRADMGRVEPGLILSSVKNGVATLTMNDPKKLNGWTGPMMLTLRHLFAEHAKDDKTKVKEIDMSCQLPSHNFHIPDSCNLLQFPDPSCWLVGFSVFQILRATLILSLSCFYVSRTNGFESIPYGYYFFGGFCSVLDLDSLIRIYAFAESGSNPDPDSDQK
jgi:hypothetical protein